MESFFISEEHQQEFNKQFSTRYLIKPNREDKKRELPINIIGSRVESLSNRDTFEFRQEAILIKAHESDGITWCCEHIASLIQKKFSTWKICCFNGDSYTNGLPEVVRWIGLRNLIKIIKNSDLKDINISSGYSKIFAYFLIAVFLNTLLLVLSKIFVENLGITFLTNIPYFHSPLSQVILIIILSILYVAVAALASNIRLGKDSRLIIQIGEKLRSAGQQRAYRAVVEQVALQFLNLTFENPIFVIVDDFSQLDDFTRNVLQEATTLKTTPLNGTLLWIVFEKAETSELLRRLKVDHPFTETLCNGRHFEYMLDNFTYEERVRICEKLNIPIKSAHHVLIRNVVRGISDKEVEEFRVDWSEFAQLESKSKGINASDLFRIMTLNGWSPFDLTENTFVGIFSGKTDSLFYLAVLEPNGLTYLKRQQVLRMLRKVRDRLSRFIVCTNKAGEPFRIRRVAHQIIENDEKGSISNDDIHLFWLIYRARQVDSASHQTLQKIAYHADRAAINPSFLATDNGKKLCIELFTKLILIARKCLHKTLFTQAIKIGYFLTENCYTLGKTDLRQLPEFVKIVAKLVEVSWQTYVLTGNEAFLQAFLDLLANEYLQLPKKTERDISDSVSTIYFRLIGIPQSLRKIGASCIEKVSGENRELFRRIEDFNALSVADIIYYLDKFVAKTDMENCNLPTFRTISDQLNSLLDVEIYERLDSEERQTFSILDFKNLQGFIRNLVRSGQGDVATELILTFVLKIRLMTSADSHPSAGDAAIEELSLLEKALLLESLATCMSSIIASAAMEMKERFVFPRQAYGKNQKLLQSLDILKSLQSPHIKRAIERLAYSISPGESKYFYAENIYPGERINDVADIVDDIYKLLGQPSTHVWTRNTPIASKILSRTEELFMQAAIAWEEFGLEEMRDRTLIERAQFIFDYSNIDPYTPGTYESVFNSLTNSLISSGSRRILSHLIISRFLSPLRDSSGQYLRQVTCSLIDGEFDDDLKYLFCIISLEGSSFVDAHILRIVEYINQRFGDEAQLKEFGSKFGPDRILWLVHELFEYSRLSNNEQLYSSAVEIANKVLSDPSFNLKDEIIVYIAFHTFMKRIREKEEIKVTEVLSEWEAWKEHWLYAAVLEVLCIHYGVDEEYIRYILSYLDTRNTPFDSTSELHLLRAVTKKVIERNDERHFLKCKDLLIRKTVPMLGYDSIENALQTFELLVEVDQENKNDYWNAHAQWTSMKLERDKIKKIGDMIAKGYYWGVFENYVSALGIYDLPIVSEDSSFCERVKKDDFENLIEIIRTEDLNKRLALTKAVNGRQVILADFILLGKLAFSSQFKSSPDIEELRSQINTATKEQIGDFFRILSNCKAIPAILRDIIHKHSKEIELLL